MTHVPTLRIDHVTILARDIARSAHFHDALWPLLGLTKQHDHVWHDGAGFYVQLLAAKAGTRDYERYGPGVNHIGFGANSPDRVAAVRDAMRDAGFDMPEIQNLGGATALFAKDPDGFRIEVTHYGPGAKVVD